MRFLEVVERFEGSFARESQFVRLAGQIAEAGCDGVKVGDAAGSLAPIIRGAGTRGCQCSGKGGNLSK